MLRPGWKGSSAGSLLLLWQLPGAPEGKPNLLRKRKLLITGKVKNLGDLFLNAREVKQCLSLRSERRTRKQNQTALRGWHVTTKTRPRIRQGSCEKISWKRTAGGVSRCLYHPCLLLAALLVLSWNKEVLSPWCGLGCGLNAGGHHKQDRCSLERQAMGPSPQSGRCWEAWHPPRLEGWRRISQKEERTFQESRKNGKARSTGEKRMRS